MADLIDRISGQMERPKNLQRMQVAAGVFVRCNEGDEEKIKAKFAHLRGRRKR